jgi:hypothetical protein
VRVIVDVLHDRCFAALQHAPGDTITQPVNPAPDFIRRQAVGVADREILASRLPQYHPPAVEAEEFRDQVKHFADHRAGLQAFSHQPRRLSDHQQFLVLQTFGVQCGSGHGGLL